MAAPIRKSQFVIWGLFLCISCSLSFTDDDDFEIASDSILTVEHTFDSGADPVFTKRGTIIIRSIKSGSADFSQERSLNPDEIDKLKDLVTADDLYRVRISSKALDGNLTHVLSFVKACSLYESLLTDKLTVHMDMSGNVIGLSITTPSQYCLGSEVSERDLERFSTTVDVMQTVPGSAPETQSYVEKMDRDKAEKAKGQQPDNRSFFAKYWMYIVPVVIIMMFANNQDPNAQGGSGGGGGGGRG